MNLKRTAYYPVRIDERQIIDDPQRRERDVAWKYRAHAGVIGLRGSRLMQHKCYEAFELVTPDCRCST